MAYRAARDAAPSPDIIPGTTRCRALQRREDEASQTGEGGDVPQNLFHSRGHKRQEAGGLAAVLGELVRVTLGEVCIGIGGEDVPQPEQHAAWELHGADGARREPHSLST